MNNKAREICDREGWGIPYVMILSYILDKGEATIREITDEQIAELEGNGLMTESFVQGLVRTAREVVLNCEQSDIVRLFKSDWCCGGGAETMSEVYNRDLDMFVPDREEE